MSVGATGSPETTQALLATNRPRARASAGTVHSLVTSPEPMSSARNSRSFASRAAPVSGFIEREDSPKSEKLPFSGLRTLDLGP